ncbi:HAD-IA family hydrolase, partial [Streptomyces sp. N502]
PLPDVVVTADDVRRGKPDPEGYRTAARRLGVDPRASIVFEDAELGLIAGRAAGGYTVVVGPHGGGAAQDRPRITDYRGLTCTDTGDALRLTLPVLAGAAL